MPSVVKLIHIASCLFELIELIFEPLRAEAGLAWGRNMMTSQSRSLCGFSSRSTQLAFKFDELPRPRLAP